MSTATIRAIRAVDQQDADAAHERFADDLAESIEDAGNVVRLAGQDHEADVERLAETMRGAIAFRTKRIGETRKTCRQTVARFNAEIDRLKGEIAAAKEGAARSVETDERVITASKAFLAAVEKA